MEHLFSVSPLRYEWTMRRSTERIRVIEQNNLLGGADLLAWSPRGARRKRVLNVDRRWKVGFAAALALVIEHGKSQQVPSVTRCPRCRREGLTERDFGVRILEGERRPQSWCRRCRSAHLPPSRRAYPVQEVLAFEGGSYQAA